MMQEVLKLSSKILRQIPASPWALVCYPQARQAELALEQQTLSSFPCPAHQGGET